MSGQQQWRPWPGGPYEVSNLGRIRRTTATRTTCARYVLSPYKEKTTGYLLVGLRDHKGVRKTRHVHVVVAEVWHGPRPTGLVVNHKDGDRTNCAPDNLEYITHAANVVDGIERAQRRNASVMTHSLIAVDVVEIRRRAAAGELVKDLAKAYGVHRTTISAVVLRQTWRHVA